MGTPGNPEMTGEPSCVSLGPVGVMVSGSYLFSALDAAGRDAVAFEIKDRCQGHPEQNGSYHYHSLTTCLEEFDESADGHSALVGYALDGFGIHGHHGEGGEVVTNGNLDECHGHTHTVEWDGDEPEMYHYHATWEYPYTIGCFRGTPVDTGFSHGGGGGGGGGGGEGGPPPPPGDTPPAPSGEGAPPGSVGITVLTRLRWGIFRAFPA